MKHFSHLNTATEIIGLYNGKEPFHLFIKDFFRQDKKYGSKDRKQITQLCYCYFRLGKFIAQQPVLERILTGLFLCADENNELLAAIKPEWNEKINLPLDEKLFFLNIPFETLNIFPGVNELSDAINQKEFILSHLQQPDVFLRIRPGYYQTVFNKLDEAGISYTLPVEDCISIPNHIKADTILLLNKEAVVQDYSSQHTGSLMQLVKQSSKLKVWDCCAASGGKSIMAHDILGNIDLVVSDIRESVLINLKKRFSEAGIKNYKMLQADLAKEKINLPVNSFDFIIADVPCSGSGTWGRTPERLSFFDTEEIKHYQSLQKKIISSVMPHLKTGGHLLYITCSAFTKENEAMVNFIQQNFSVEIIQTSILKGYKVKADTMFAALVRKKV